MGDQFYHAVSFSGGKDSTAMLLLMIERGMPIDIVLTADTGMEFPEMYEHLNRLDDYLFRERGIHLTTLRHPKGFEWLMFDEPKQKESSIANRQRLGVSLHGNGWPGVKVRWCTGQLKTHLISKEVNHLKGEYNALHYVGIAADEPKRIKNEVYPLVDWGITEAQALKICYDRGYDWGGLYEIYHRCSCWCCPLQRIGELKKLRQHHPELWERLREMDKRAIAQFGHNALGQFKQDWTVERLEQRFALEDAQIGMFEDKKTEVSMEIDKWVGPYKVRAIPWTDRKQIYFNVRYFLPGQSLDKPPAWDRTVYITDDRAGRRLVFEFTDTLADYVANLQMKVASDNKIVITIESEPPNLLAGCSAHEEPSPQHYKNKRHNEPER